MSEKRRYKNLEYECTLGEMRRGAIKYAEALTKVMEQEMENSPISIGKGLIMMGYAMGVVAGKANDIGIEGFSLVLNGIKMSMLGEDRKEEIQFAVWDKNGDLHTSEEGFQTKEGGDNEQ